MKIFISGGCKNGKSTLAQTLAVRQRERAGDFSALPEGETDGNPESGAASGEEGISFVQGNRSRQEPGDPADRLFRKPPLYYLATMVPRDEEDRIRISRHRQERMSMGFETVEIGRNIIDALDRCDPEGSFLLDSLTALLANEMFFVPEQEEEAGLCGGRRKARFGGKERAAKGRMPAEARRAAEAFCPPPGKREREAAVSRVEGQLSRLLLSLENIVIVSDFIYSDGIRYDEAVEDYRRGLARLDRLCARQCRVAAELCAGTVICHKGGDAYQTLV